MIYAVSIDDIIGFDNELPWRIKSELEYFKKVTTDNVVVMGGNTFRSLGSKPLPNRINYVLSKGTNFNPDVIFVDSIETIKDFPRWYKDKDVFVIGGASLYEQLKDYVDSVYKTEVLMTLNDKVPPNMNPVKFDMNLDGFVLRDDLLITKCDMDTSRGIPIQYTVGVYDRVRTE